MIYGARKPKCESSIEMRITTNIYTEANFRFLIYFFNHYMLLLHTWFCEFSLNKIEIFFLS